MKPLGSGSDTNYGTGIDHGHCRHHLVPFDSSRSYTNSELVPREAWMVHRTVCQRQPAMSMEYKYTDIKEREETIMVNRLIRDDPGKGTMHNRQPVTLSLIWMSLKDHDLWFVP